MGLGRGRGRPGVCAAGAGAGISVIGAYASISLRSGFASACGDCNVDQSPGSQQYNGVYANNREK
jgi:hypothetical protein